MRNYVGLPIFLASIITPCFAQDAPRPKHDSRPWEAGLEYPYRVSFGSYRISSQDSFDRFILDRSGIDLSSTFIKIDYSVFRPTRHEAMLSLTHFEKVDLSFDKPDDMVSFEYRWRFFGKGAGYYGINIGTGVGDEAWGSGVLLSGSSFGFHFTSNLFAEIRYVYNSDNESDRRAVAVGIRF